jgi:hypothetical protein
MLFYTSAGETISDCSAALEVTMGSDQLMARYSRLRQELTDAFARQPWHGDHIDRLANELAQTERGIAAPAPRDEQCSDALPPLTA